MLDGFVDPLVMATAGLVLGAELKSESQVGCEVFTPHSRGPYRKAFGVKGAAAQVGVGASMAFRREFMLNVGGFPEELDAGRPTATGGDTWAFDAVLSRGYRALYEPRAVVKHWHRESSEALEKMMESNSSGAWALVWKNLSAGFLSEACVSAKNTFLWNFQTIRNSLRGRIPKKLARAELRGAVFSIANYYKARRSVREVESVVLSESAVTDIPALWIPPSVQKDQYETDGLPSVSAIIPSRGRRIKLIKLVKALAELPGISQLVVAIDGDIDGSVAALSQLSLPQGWLRVVELHPKSDVADHGSGAGVARNAAAAVATGDVLLFVDDDVRIQSADFALRHARLNVDKQRVLGIGPALVDQRDAKHSAEQFRRNWWVDHTRRLHTETVLGWPDVCTGNLSIRREFLNGLGGFDEGLPRREDWDLGIRALSNGAILRADYAAAVMQRDEKSQLFSLDAYRDGLADSIIATRSGSYSAQTLPHIELAKVRALPMFRWAYKNPKPALIVARLVLPLARAVPFTKTRTRIERLWAGFTYYAGRGESDTRLKQKRSPFYFDPSLIKGTVNLGESFPFDLLADGRYLRYAYRGTELGVASTIQDNCALTVRAAGYRLISRFLPAAAKVVSRRS